jgi:hypothetical protein
MCNCIQLSEEALIHNGSNTTLDRPIMLSKVGKLDVAQRVTISTCKRDPHRKEKPMRLFATYCPFCGEKYEDAEE